MTEEDNVQTLLSQMMLDSDLWADADMECVVTYLRGGHKLNVPAAIRQVLAMDKWIQMVFFFQLFNKKTIKH